MISDEGENAIFGPSNHTESEKSDDDIVIVAECETNPRHSGVRYEIT